MNSIAAVSLSLLSTAAASLLSSFAVLRIVRPRRHPVFDIVFAALYSTFLLLFVVLFSMRFPMSPCYSKLFLMASATSLVGLWLSVSVHICGFVYDVRVLHIKQPSIQRHGWPWEGLRSSVTHMVSALLFAAIAVVAATHLQTGGQVSRRYADEAPKVPVSSAKHPAKQSVKPLGKNNVSHDAQDDANAIQQQANAENAENAENADNAAQQAEEDLENAAEPEQSNADEMDNAALEAHDREFYRRMNEVENAKTAAKEKYDEEHPQQAQAAQKARSKKIHNQIKMAGRKKGDPEPESSSDENGSLEDDSNADNAANTTAPNTKFAKLRKG